MLYTIYYTMLGTLPAFASFVPRSHTFALQLASRRNTESSLACIRSWEIKPADENLSFIHIGKCAGTSMDSWWVRSDLDFYEGFFAHVDMSFVIGQGSSPRQAMTWLREPGARAASNILFWKRLSFAEDWTSHVKNWTLRQIVESEEELQHYQGAFSDGWGGTCYLAGVCQNGWYIKTNPEGKDEHESKRRERVLTTTQALDLAKNNLAQLVWFGIMERLEDSLELLQWQLGRKTFADFPLRNLNKKRSVGDATPHDEQALRKMTPMDVALYEYATELFEYRWQQYQLAKSQGLHSSDAGCMQEPNFQAKHADIPVLPFHMSHGEFPDDPSLSDFFSGEDF